MPTLDEIRSQIAGLDGVSRLLGRKEIKELPKILWGDEQVERIVQGFYGGGTGVLVATNKRLIFVDKGLLYGLKVEDFPYDKVSSIQYETGLMFGSITIYTSGNKAVIEHVEKQQARAFGEFARARTTARTRSAAFTGPAPHAASSNPAGDDVVSRLERLAQLRDRGVLSEQEFAEQKQRILA